MEISEMDFFSVAGRSGTWRRNTYLEMGSAPSSESSLDVSCTVRREVIVPLAPAL